MNAVATRPRPAPRPIPGLAERQTRRRRQPTVELVVDNRSGKWSQDARPFRHGLMTSARDNVAAILLTETTEDHQADVLDGIPGYQPLHDLTNGDRDEVAILIDPEQLRLERWVTTVLGPDMGPGGRVVGGIATVHILAANRPAVLAVWHSPSSVEGDWDGYRAGVYRSSLDRLRQEVRAERRRIGPGASVLVGGDWNLDFRKPWVRDEIKDAWPALSLPRLPLRGGTHHDRYIDPVLVDGVRRARLSHLPRVRGDDHRPQRLTCRVPIRPEAA